MEQTEMKCELLEKCGFFKKYQNTIDLACRGFIKRYCNGNMMNECKRMEYRNQHGVPPSEDMMPSGHIMTADMMPSK
jgi:hypothetical protein